MKKGFTLIELLAVIVILAIIALIATPIVLNIIEESRDNSNLRSAEMYLDAVEMSIATSNLNNKKISNGTYNILENGNICLEYQDIECKEELKVEVDGKKPETGSTVTIKNGKIENISLILNNKTIVKNNKGQVAYALTINDICTYKGTDQNKKYELGSEYECDPGDGIKRTFYVIEDGDTTTLTKTDGSVHYDGDGIGTADKREVSLIVNQNIGYSSYINLDDYELSGGDSCYFEYEGECVERRSTSLYGPVTANRYLKEETIDKGWKTEVYLPTYDQYTQISDDIGSDQSINITEFTWISSGDAYWLMTGSNNIYHPWVVCEIVGDGNIWLASSGWVMAPSDEWGIRPVITVYKN